MILGGSLKVNGRIGASVAFRRSPKSSHYRHEQTLQNDKKQYQLEDLLSATDYNGGFC